MSLLSAAVIAGCGTAPKAEAPKKADHAPDSYRVKFETTKGDVVIEVTRSWAPRGADRFYELVNDRFFDGARFFRVVKGFVAQFGLKGDPKIDSLWGQMKMPDDPVVESNRKGTIAFAMDGPASRTTEVFINLANNARLDKRGFAPFGKVVEGMDNVELFCKLYGDMAPRGPGPDPIRIQKEGNTYLDRDFPRLDRIKKAGVIK